MMNKVAVLLFIGCVSGCFKLDDEYEKFSREAECNVTYDEVVSENCGGYKVEYINTNVASGCLKSNMKDTYILNVTDNYYVVVEPNHPRENIQLIEKLISNYQSDSIRVNYLFYNASTVKVGLERLYLDPSDHSPREFYYQWMWILLSWENGKWKVEKTMETNYWPWAETK